MSTPGEDPAGRSRAVWELDVRDSGPDLPARVRRWAATALADLGEDHLADVVLVAVELVTNAYEHGGGPRTVRVARSHLPCRIDIEVEDSNVNQLTVGVSRFGPAAHRGRGLIIVENITDTWGGTQHAETGDKTVWARVSCANIKPCPLAPARHAPGSDEPPNSSSTVHVTVPISAHPSDLTERPSAPAPATGAGPTGSPADPAARDASVNRSLS